jgi:DNA-binding CsgD family transcriptional regulator
LHELYSLFVDLSERAPLLVAIDDAQWSDPASLQLARFLSRRVRELPVVLLLARAGRDTDASSEQLTRIAGDPETICLRLRPLSAKATRAVVRARAWPQAGDALCETCHATTGGNPFLLLALLDELVRQGSDSSPPAIDEVRSAAPASVTRAVLGRLERLPPAAAPLARAVAVLGDETELWDAATLASIDSSVAREAADALVRAEIFRPGGPISFVQPIIRLAIYADLSATAKSEAHAQAARTLAAGHGAPDRTAAHLIATEPVGERWALEVLRQAARYAIGRDSLENAASYLRRALNEPLDTEQRAAILRELGIAETRAALPLATGYFQEALALLRPLGGGALRTRAEITRLLSASLLLDDRGDEALLVLEALITELGSDERELRLGLEANLAAVAVFYARHAPAIGKRLDHLEEELGGAASAESRLLAIFAHRRMQLSEAADEAGSMAARAIADDQLLAEQVDFMPLFITGTVLDLAGRFDDAEQLFSDVLDRASPTGDLMLRAFASAGRGLARFHRGALGDARADAQDALDAASGRGWTAAGEQTSLGCLIQIAIVQGRLDACEDELGCRGLAGALPNTIPGNQLLVARGCLRLAQGLPRDALTDLAEAGRRARSWARTIQFEWRNPCATAHHLLGDRERALALARQSRDLATDWGAGRQLGAALGTLGLIEGGVRGIDQLRRAVEVLEGSGAQLERARALVNLGSMLRRTRQPSEACRYLHAGFELATSCGAVALSGAAAAELAAVGVRTLSRSEHGRSGTLTPHERRIAEMAAGGLSNPEIAEALFVTRKTVEMHLGNSYRKLGISARAQLAAAVGPS